MMRWPMLTVGFMAVCATLARAEQAPPPKPLVGGQAPVALTVSVDRSEVVIGEPIRYVMTLEHPQGMRATFPPFRETIGEFTVEEFGSERPRRTGGSILEEQWYQLAIYVTGSHTIPEPVAAYGGAGGTEHEVRGQAIPITVKSLLPPDWESQDIRDAKPLVLIPRRGWLWALGLLALLGGVAGVWWWRRQRLLPEPAAPPPRPPHEVTLEELERLRQDDLSAHNRYEEYYTRLSNIVRTYIEAQFSLRAPDMTTEEFLQTASTAHTISSDHRLLLQDFMMRCDLVKFARYQPSEREADDVFSSVGRFIQETIPSQAPAEMVGSETEHA